MTQVEGSGTAVADVAKGRSALASSESTIGGVEAE